MIRVGVAELLAACACMAWAETVAGEHDDLDALLVVGERAWWAVGEPGWREALAAHPAIGAPTVAGSREQAEQGGAMAGAARTVDGADLLARLHDGNAAYAGRFGMTYVVRAAGRSLPELLALLDARLGNDPGTELRVAAGQQWEITALRLTALVGSAA